jgi:FMNH2-dependent dimethyl sulfone monooxygenase
VRAYPKPYGETRPIIMNAGRSPIGQAFALRNCDAFFTATVDSRHSIGANAKKVKELKSAAQTIGRDIEAYTVGQVICRPTQKEADDYYHYAVIDNADWGAVDQLMALKNITRQTVTAAEFTRQQRYFAGKGIGGYPFVGTPDQVAQELANISQAGMRGIAVSFVNYLDELPYFRDEVLPRLAKLGLRQEQ